MKNMKKLLVFLVALAAMLCLFVFGASAYADTEYGNTGLYYSISNNEVTITDAVDNIISVNIPESIYGYPVTSIGDDAFYGCTGLTSITIPGSVTSIGRFAFEDCTGLTSVHITDLEVWCKISFGSSYSNPLYYAEKLYINGVLATNITIPDSVTSIGKYAFSGYDCLTSVTISDSVTSIGNYAFRDCTGLTKINWNAESVSDFDFDSDVFYNAGTSGDGIDVVFGDNVKKIPAKAFYYCTGLTSVTIGNSVTSIGGYAFEDCTGLTSLHITDLAAWCNISFGSSSANPLYYADNLYINGVLATDITIPDSVTSIGKYAFSGYDCLTSVTIPDSVTSIGEGAFEYCTRLTSVTIPDSVTSIGDDAFYYCTGLTSITIPDSVTSIGSSAFGNCTGLTTINWNAESVSDFRSVFYNVGTSGSGIDVVFGDNVKNIPANAFYYCTGLTSVTIPDSVTSIGSYAFRGCTGLTSVTIPDSVTSIGSYAFRGCTGLTSVTIPDSVTSIGDDAFSDCTGLASVHITDLAAWCKISFGSSYANPLYYAKKLYINGELATNITIPDSVTSIGNYAFYYCKCLTSVTIGDGVTRIGDSAFYYCTGLTSIIIPDSVTSIGGGAFAGTAWYNAKSDGDIYVGRVYYKYKGTMSTKTSIVFKKGTISISGSAFYNCTSLTSVTIPDSVTSIGGYAFYNCTGLTSVTIPDSVTNIGGYAFYNCTGLTSVTIPDSVTSIGRSAFYYCTGLTSITIGNSVTSIGDSAFRGCTGLTSVTIGNSVTSIGEYAFYGCKCLTSITIPDSVTSIGDYAFYICTGLTSVNIPDSVTSIGRSSFYYCTGLTKINWNAESVSDFDSDSDVFYNAGTSGDGIDVVFGDNVKNIPANAFCVSYSSSRPKIKSVTIGNSVTSIGDDAFSGCTSLTEIYWNAESVSDFDSDSNVFYNAGTSGDGIDVVFGDNVKKIPANAFYGSYRPKIKSVTIGNSVTSIGRSAFYYCTGLTSVHITDLAAWCKISFGSSSANPLYYTEKLYINGELATNITIPDSVTSIGGYAFYNCTGLTSVTIGNSVTSIGDDAFYDCTGLTKINWNAESVSDFDSDSKVFYNAGKYGDGIDVVFGNNVKSIPVNAFYVSESSYRPKIKSVTIGNSVTSIGNYAFYYCTGLASVTIGNGVTSIGYSAFSGCTGLTSVTIGNSVTSIGGSAFYNCTGLTNITIPDSVTSIGGYAFYDCTGLTSVTIGNSVTSIGDYAFSGCTGLTSITIPDSVTSIGVCAFSGCSDLTSVTIGNGLKYIGNIFSGSNKIASLKVSDSVERIQSGIFDYTDWYEDHPYGDVYVGKVYYKYKGTMPAQTDIILKKGTKGITDGAFENSSGINTLTIPDSVTNIGSNVFVYKQYYGWKNVRINTLKIEDLTAWCKIDFDGYYANPLGGAGTVTINGKTLSTLTVPSSITEIKDYAFCSFDTIEKVVIPKSVKRIGSSAFYSCDNLSRVTIPGSVKTIGDGAFEDCNYLSYVELENGIETIGGKAFYDTDIRYLIIPDSVKSIGYEAFNCCHDLTDLTVGNGITAIDSNAFKESSNLARIRIGKNVKSIGENAFSGLKNIPTVYYAGSQTEWKNVSIDKSNEFILRATMHYNADISHKHNYAEKITKNATCTKNGSKTLTCECGKTGTQSIPAKGHTAVTDKAVAPTCTKSGKTEGSHCKVCGTVLTAQKTISATGHTYKTTKTLATTSKDGKTVTACTVCGYVTKTTTYYRASSIKLSATTYTYNGKVQKPTVTVKNSKGTTLKNGTDYTVSYSSGCKNTGKYAVKVTFKGNYTGSKTLYFTILPGKTSSLNASQTTTSIKATWKSVAGASGYIVTLYNSSGKVVKTVDTTKTTYTFSKLSAGTVYKVKVTAYKTIDSKKTNSKSYALLTTTTKPGTPTLKVTAGSKKATLSWNKQTGATGYVVYMATSKNGKYTKIATVNGNSSVKFTKSGLTKGKTYYFKVAAYKTVDGKTIYGANSSVRYAKIK